MKRTSNPLSLRPWLCPVLLWLALALPAFAQAEAVTVIVHADNPVTEISVEDLSKIFLGKADSFPGGQKADPVDQAEEQPAYSLFAAQVHDRSLNALKSYWARRIFAGEGAPPRRLASDAEALAYVAANASAIGYVKDATTLTGVKTVKVNGLKSAP